MPFMRQAIIEILNARGPLPLGDVARAVHLSNLAARYHLGLLMRDGLVLAQPAGVGGRVGRPRMLYRLAEPARERLPKQYDRLAVTLLDEIVETWGTGVSVQLLRRVGRRVAVEALPLRGGLALTARIARAAKFLSERGYMPSVEGDQLRVRNCPFRAVAREHPEVCELDIALVSALLHVPVKRFGGDECRFGLATKS